MYRPISDYGMIGNCRSCALVSSLGSIDWMCLPDFDSPAQFCAILDEDKGGFFQIHPKGFYQSNQRYKDNTNLLKTYFFNHSGTTSLTDFMPLSRQEDESGEVQEWGTKLVRLVKAIKGHHEYEVRLKMTPDFVRENVKIKKINGAVVIESKKGKYVLYKKHHKVEIKNQTIIICFSLNEGQQEFFCLDYLEASEIVPSFTKQQINAKLAKLYAETIIYWQDWVSECTYTGDYSEQVLRSALTLKMLTYRPTGAIVAAPTTSLPEKIGGNLNWDYRYTWLRDASFTVYALLGLGFLNEAGHFMDWLEKICLKDALNLKIMYRVRGEGEIDEQELSHLSGYMKSKPVRIGNGAQHQKQLDIFGEVLTAIYLYIESGGKVSAGIQSFVKLLTDYCCNHWHEADAGIWEPRYGVKHNTYSKLMCWSGIDRGINIAKKLKIHQADLKLWESTKQKIKEDILKNGYSKKVESFVTFYGSDSLDTGNLNIPITGLLPADDKRVLSTLERVMEKLVIDWFVLRTSDTENKLQEGEGTFFLSTFWLIDNLSLLGRVEEAKVWYERLLRDASPLGLYAEQFDPLTRRHLGNYPQAFTHLGLINSALNIKQAEMFGSETKATNQIQRLGKVFKSLLKTSTRLKATKKLKQLVSFANLTQFHL